MDKMYANNIVQKRLLNLNAKNYINKVQKHLLKINMKEMFLFNLYNQNYQQAF